MKIQKKLFSLLFATVLVLCATVVFACAEDTVVVVQGGFRYELDLFNSTATVTGPEGECPENVRIPSIVDYNGNGYGVVAVGDGGVGFYYVALYRTYHWSPCLPWLYQSHYCHTSQNR